MSFQTFITSSILLVLGFAVGFLVSMRKNYEENRVITVSYPIVLSSSLSGFFGGHLIIAFVPEANDSLIIIGGGVLSLLNVLFTMIEIKAFFRLFVRKFLYHFFNVKLK